MAEGGKYTMPRKYPSNYFLGIPEAGKASDLNTSNGSENSNTSRL
jgi:hypothetical protein